MARTAIPLYVTNQLVTAAHGNTYWRDNESAHWAAIQAPLNGCALIRTAVQSIPHNTETAISWESAQYDDDSYWTIASPTRITIPEDGRYLVGGSATYGAMSSDTNLLLALNGTARWTLIKITTVAAVFSGVTSLIVFLSAADYIELTTTQNSGGAVNYVGSAYPRFWIAKV